MAQDYTTTTVIPSPIRTYYDRKLLERLLPNLIHDTGAESRPLKARSGDQIKFRRLESLAAQTASLEEGVTPSPIILDDTQITSTIGQYGGYSIITDMVSMTDYDPIISETVGLMGEMMGNTIDQTIRDVLVAGTYFIRCDGAATYSTSGARNTVDNHLNKEALKAAVRQLESYNVSKFKPKVGSAPGYGSSAVPEAYICYIHPHVKYDLITSIGSTNGFIPVHKYASYADLLPGEIGAFEDGIRFVMSTNCKIWVGEGASGTTVYRNNGSNFNVYGSIMVGKGFYAVTTMDGGVRTIVKSREQEGGPLNQRSTVGAIAEHVTTILNDYCGVRIEACASL